jgi:hypothetical protein
VNAAKRTIPTPDEDRVEKPVALPVVADRIVTISQFAPHEMWVHRSQPMYLRPLKQLHSVQV